MVVYIENCSLWCGCGYTTLIQSRWIFYTALFADEFDSKQSNDNLTMPRSYFPQVELTTFRSGEVKKLLLEFDPHVGSGPDGILPLFFYKNC